MEPAVGRAQLEGMAGRSEASARPDRRSDPAGTPLHSFAWRDALVGSAFEELRFETFPNGAVLDRERLLARVSSWSHVAALSERERRAFLDEIAAHLSEPAYPATLETHLYWTRLRA